MAIFAAVAIGVGLASTGAIVGTTVWGIKEGEKQADQEIANQEEYSLLSAHIALGQAIVEAPGAIRT